MTDTQYALERLDSGECRWIGRHDIHVYCHAPAKREPAYCVVCPDAGLEHGNWMDAPRAAKLVDQIHARLGD
jgi:hypothetical protein